MLDLGGPTSRRYWGKDDQAPVGGDRCVNLGARVVSEIRISPLMKTKIKNRFTARGWRSLIVLTGPRLSAGPGYTQVWVNPSTRGEYKFGQWQGFVDRDFTAAQAAAKIALKDLGLFETRDDRKPAEAELRAHDSADTLVTVKMKEAGKTSRASRFATD